jgi:hypothetical protein
MATLQNLNKILEPKLEVKIKRWHGVAEWTWGMPDEVRPYGS